MKLILSQQHQFSFQLSVTEFLVLHKFNTKMEKSMEKPFIKSFLNRIKVQWK